jgi:Tfp pilus assembly protein PilF
MNKTIIALSMLSAFTLLSGCITSASTYRTPELTKASRLNNEGYDRMAANDPNSAKPYFDQALVAEPNLAIAHLNLGAVYQNTGHPEAAAGEYRLAIANDTDANDYPKVLETTDGKMGTVSEIANRNLAGMRGVTGATQ